MEAEYNQVCFAKCIVFLKVDERNPRTNATECFDISLFPKEITVHSGIVCRDKIYGDRRQICERVEVSTIKYRPKKKYLLFTLNF